MQKNWMLVAALLLGGCGVEPNEVESDATAEVSEVSSNLASAEIGKLSVGQRFEIPGPWVRRTWLNRDEMWNFDVPQRHQVDELGAGSLRVDVKTVNRSQFVFNATATADVTVVDATGEAHVFTDVFLGYDSYSARWTGRAGDFLIEMSTISTSWWASRKLDDTVTEWFRWYPSAT